MGITYSATGISGFPFDFINQFLPHGYKVCVETGTYFGGTTMQLANIFDKVYTIEASEKIYYEAQKNLCVYQNVISKFGKSQILLPQVLKEDKDAKFVFWLDAHHSGGDTFENTCPLLEEISIINTLCNDPIVIIDDARFINMKHCDDIRYAELQEFIPLLHNGSRYISCVDDKYIAVPRKFKNNLDSYTQISSSMDNRAVSTARQKVFNYVRKFFTLIR